MGMAGDRRARRGRTVLPFRGLTCAVLLRVGLAQVPCGPSLQLEVEVGEVRGFIGFSTFFEHNSLETRSCRLINSGYEGEILIGCTEGELNATVDDCRPARCHVHLAYSVAIGALTTSVTPRAAILSGSHEVRLCRELNPLYRGQFSLFCDYGTLSVDVRECLPQYDVMDPPPWEARARHAAVTLGDGALLLVGGLGLNGPLREVWQWTPISRWDAPPRPPHRDPLGSWEQPWAVPVPPWSGRYGSAAVWRASASGEQVMLLGGNDNLNRNDVWRWLRQATVVDVALDDSDVTGTQPQDCSLLAGGATLHCHATDGVVGRRWYISEYLQPSTAVHVEVRLTNEDARGVAAFAVQLGGCRLVFQLSSGNWSAYGCSGDDPPWAQPDPPKQLGPSGPPGADGWMALRLTIDRSARQLRLSAAGHELPALDVPEAQPTANGVTSCGAGQAAYSTDEASGACVAAPGGSDLPLQVVELVAWPLLLLEARHLAMTAPAGYWQLLAEEAPWVARSTHAAVPLPDGDVLLMGGIGNGDLLNDVWRWSPRRCTLLPETTDAEAVRYALECSYPCTASAVHGQWTRLPNAPWAPRQEHAAIWTASGAIVLGGRTALGFKNDVWRWEFSGEFCSLAWQGRWEQLTPAAAWPARVGHGIVGFTPSGQGPAETLLLFGGFGGSPETEQVSWEVLEEPVRMRNDLWCANLQLGNFAEWLQLAPFSPFSARTQVGLVAAPMLGGYSMVIFGGYDRNARFTADFWRWSGESATTACKAESI